MTGLNHKPVSTGTGRRLRLALRFAVRADSRKDHSTTDMMDEAAAVMSGTSVAGILVNGPTQSRFERASDKQRDRSGQTGYR